MAGELSKSSGEYGEAISKKLLEEFGWNVQRKKFDIKCKSPDKHKHNKDGTRRTHGIDLLVYLDDPMYDNVQTNVLISVKNRDIYKTTQFRGFYKDLAFDLECFRFSNEAKSKRKKQVLNIGVIFWLSYEDAPDYDVISKLIEPRNTDDFKFDAIYVVDNLRVNFVLGSIEFAKKLSVDQSCEFVYQPTQFNSEAINGKRSQGSYLPVQAVNSSILPLKVKQSDNEYCLLITTLDPFSADHLKRMIGLAHALTENWVSKVIIGFLDFNNFKNQQSVDAALAEYNDSDFAQKVSVKSFKLGNYDELVEGY